MPHLYLCNAKSLSIKQSINKPISSHSPQPLCLVPAGTRTQWKHVTCPWPSWPHSSRQTCVAIGRMWNIKNKWDCTWLVFGFLGLIPATKPVTAVRHLNKKLKYIKLKTLSLHVTFPWLSWPRSIHQTCGNKRHLNNKLMPRKNKMRSACVLGLIPYTKPLRQEERFKSDFRKDEVHFAVEHLAL